MAQRLMVAVLVTLLPPAGVGAQDAVVTRNVNLRQDPSTAHPPLRLLLPGAELRLLEPDKSNNYYHVATMGDEEGWVWGNNVRLLPPPPGPAEVFNGCPMEGNASRADFRVLNRLKNRTTTPAASDMNASITLPAMLQPGDDEARWSNAQGATVTGYVYDVKSGSEESVNCGATALLDKDTHIEITCVVSCGLTGAFNAKARAFLGEVVDMSDQPAPPDDQLWRSSQGSAPLADVQVR